MERRAVGEELETMNRRATGAVENGKLGTVQGMNGVRENDKDNLKQVKDSFDKISRD